MEIPIPSEEAASLLKPSAKPKKSSSTSSLSKKSKNKNSLNNTGDSSHFITPARNDNDIELPRTQPSETTPNHKQDQLPGPAKGDNEKQGQQEITRDENVVQVESPFLPNTITKNLLEQLEQIEIKAGKELPKESTDSTVNGVNYLQVDTNSATSTPSSALSSRGTW